VIANLLKKSNETFDTQKGNTRTMKVTIFDPNSESDQMIYDAHHHHHHQNSNLHLILLVRLENHKCNNDPIRNNNNVERYQCHFDVQWIPNGHQEGLDDRVWSMTMKWITLLWTTMMDMNNQGWMKTIIPRKSAKYFGMIEKGKNEKATIHVNHSNLMISLSLSLSLL
jgi:hypothetical protein